MVKRMAMQKFRSCLLLIVLIFQTGCVSMRKRPLRILTQIQESGSSYDVLIVPGVPFEGEQWSSLMRARVLWSYFLYQRGIVRNVIYSGAAVYTPYKEAAIMRLYALELGIPDRHIFTDTLAQHSTENIYYAYRIAMQMGFKSIALGTDPVQSALLKGFTRRRFGSPIQHIPFFPDSLTALYDLQPVIDPFSAKIQADFESLTERKNTWQRFRGTMGRGIPWEKGRKKLPPL